MINTIYSVDCGCSNPIAMSGNVIKQLIVRRKLEEYDDIEHNEKNIQFKSNEAATAFVEWIETTEFPEYAANGIFPNHQDMIKDKGTLDSPAYLEMSKDRKIELNPSGVTVDMYTFWKNITNLIVGNMYVLNFDSGQVIAFDNVSDVPLFQSIISSYNDDTFPFTQAAFTFNNVSVGSSAGMYISSGTNWSNITSSSISIDLDNTVFTKGGKTVQVETK